MTKIEVWKAVGSQGTWEPLGPLRRSICIAPSLAPSLAVLHQKSTFCFQPVPRSQHALWLGTCPQEQGPADAVSQGISQARYGDTLETRYSDSIPVMQVRGLAPTDPPEKDASLRKKPPSGSYLRLQGRQGQARVLLAPFCSVSLEGQSHGQQEMRLFGVLAMETSALSPGPGPGWEGRRKQGSYFCEKRAGWGHRKGREGRQEGGWGGQH